MVQAPATGKNAMSDLGTSSDGDVTGQPRVGIVAQYIKDLSFEVPGAPAMMSQSPQIELGVDLQARRIEADLYEVELKLRVIAKTADKPLFLLELAYGGLFRVAGLPEEAMQPMLLIQAPHMLFPFARRIVADVVRDGGMPPLLIDPIDFAALYQAKLAAGDITGNPIGNA
jgi:preprotein translocase subunit SecB